MNRPLDPVSDDDLQAYVDDEPERYVVERGTPGFSGADLMNLVNNTAGIDTLTLRLGANDSYSIQAESGISFTQGQNIKFFNSSNVQVAQLNFEYA